MAGQFSTVGSNYALDFVSGRALAYTSARSTYLCLLTAAPTDASTLTSGFAEVNTAGYARQLVTWSPAGAPGVGQSSITSNTAAVTFGPFTAAMATAATSAALTNASTGTSGDFLMWWTLDFAKQANQNESIQFAIGALSMSLT